jgi:MtrB/PioB family decaheme-associated outer membrane protein
MMRNQPKVALRLSVLAVHGALLALAAPLAFAQADVAELTQPKNSIEVGAMNVSRDSAPFGQYTGLDKKGGYLIGNVELRGGGYDSVNDARRWAITGTDLGLDSRNLSAEYRDQGKFRINFGYDELLSHKSDTYQTPYSGAGGNSLTLPSTWSLLRTSTTQGNALPTTGLDVGNTAGGLTAADLAAFQKVDLKTKRKKTDLGFSFDLDTRWSISASVRHEDKDGLQAIGQTFYSTSGGQVTLPNPIHYTTDQLNLSLNFKGENYFSNLSYYGSIFKDDITSVSYSNAFQVYSPGSTTTGAAPLFGRFATAPDNTFHQLNWSGGYNFSKTTKLVADIGYSRARQNESFIPATSFDLGTVGNAASAVAAQPNSSLNGLVVNKNVSIKLTAKPMKDLSLAASYKYDDRDNRTPVGLYAYRWGDVVANATADLRNFNTPYSRKVDTLNLVADYALGNGQAVKGSYNYERTDRSCGTLYPASTAAVPAGWSGRTTECVNVPKTKEDTLGLEYRKTMGDTLTGRIGISESRRRGDNYMLDVTQGGTSVVNGVNVSYYQTDIAAMQRFNYANRDREKVRGSINWEATKELALSAGLDYKRDKYPAMLSDPSGWTYGLEHSNGWALNLDASYQVNENLGFNAYYSYDEMKSLQRGNNTTSASGNYLLTHWTADIKDKTDTFGLGFKAGGLMGHKLELTGDLSYSRSRSPIGTAPDAGMCNIVGGTVCVAGVGLLPLPESFADATSLKLAAKYTLDKVSAVRVTYQYARLKSSDYAYLGLQPGAANNYSATYGAYSVLMPTMEQAPNYSVNVVGISYIYSFK